MLGLLLVNLGTPDSPEPRDVGRYLKEFLSDPLVIDIPAPLRWALVRFAIVPFRARSSSVLYRKIWGAEGSPLLKYTRDLAERVSGALASTHRTAFAMRYGRPSLREGLERLRGCDRIVVLPLYPQYSLAATESSVRKVREEARRLGLKAELDFVPAFYRDPGFLEAFALRIRETLATHSGWDTVVFSYHGLPERQVKRTDPTGAHCLRLPVCCDTLTDANRDCYRAQCFETSRRLATLLGLPPDRYRVAFQSRMGRTPWIRPFTDELYLTLPGQGVKRVVVASPSFVADCLETLEEIAIRGRESFLGAGGEWLALVPSLNATDRWVEAVCGMVRSRST